MRVNSKLYRVRIPTYIQYIHAKSIKNIQASIEKNCCENNETA